MFAIGMSTIIGILMTYLIPCLIFGILEYYICKKFYKYAMVLPIVTFLYFIILMFSDLSIFTKLMTNLYGVLLGFVMVIAFASLFITTSLIYYIWTKKNT